MLTILYPTQSEIEAPQLYIGDSRSVPDAESVAFEAYFWQILKGFIETDWA